MESIIIQIVLFQLMFWVFYELFLRRETFFEANRVYLIISSLLSLLLPFVKIPFFNKQLPVLQEQLINQLPTVFIGGTNANTVKVLKNNTVTLEPIKSWYETLFTLENCWLIVGCVFLLVLLYKLIRILYLEKTQASRWQEDYVLVQLPNTNEAFSFFNRIFLGSQLINPERKTILEHEKVHVEQYHSLDLLWFEVLRVVFWFNPVIYLYQRRISEVHEYLVDKKVSKNQDNYCEELLAHSFGVPQFSLVNQFYKSSLIKNRIKMLTKEKSNRIKLIKYLAIIPMLAVMLFYVSCSDVDKVSLNQEKSVVNKQSEVIKDVIRIVESVVPKNAMEYKDFTNEMHDELKLKLLDYSSKNSLKIKEFDEGIDFFGYYSYLLKGKEPENFNQGEKDLMTFGVTKMYVDILLKKASNSTINDNQLRGAVIFNREEFSSRIKELNYQLPNEEEWIAKYKEAKAKEELISEDVDYSSDLDVPFAVIENPPVYPGCNENGSREELKKCFSQKIAELVNENFNIKIAKENNLIGLQRIAVAFKIDKEGNIVEVRVRAPHESLVTETKRVMNLLPKMEPGMHKGKAVMVPYALPIKFKIN